MWSCDFTSSGQTGKGAEGKSDKGAEFCFKMGKEPAESSHIDARNRAIWFAFRKNHFSYQLFLTQSTALVDGKMQVNYNSRHHDQGGLFPKTFWNLYSISDGAVCTHNLSKNTICEIEP